MAPAERAKSERRRMTSSTGRPRSEEAHQAILDATLALLGEVGYSALTVEGVAQRAGVGKATIYRRWSSKLPLVVEAFGALPGFGDVDAGSLERDLKETLKKYLEAFNTTALGTVFSSLAGNARPQPRAAQADRAGRACTPRALRPGSSSGRGRGGRSRVTSTSTLRRISWWARSR